MTKAAEHIIISPINMKARQKLDIKAGDTVRVTSKIQEKGKTRLQAFEGLVIAVKHGKESGGTFTVRKITSGVGVEKIFAIYSPLLDKIEIIRRSTTRRAKLYYIRDKTARQIRRKMKGTSGGLMSTAELEELDKKEEEEAQAAAEKQVPAEEKKEDALVEEKAEASEPQEKEESTDAEENKETEEKNEDESKEDDVPDSEEKKS